MRTPFLIALSAPLALAACEPAPMTTAEQVEAVGMSVETARMDGATDGIIEISTSFTLGDGAQAAAESLRDIWASQAECATVSLDGATVTVEFGTTSGCTWNGRSWTGTAAVGIVAAGEGEVVVEHTWTDLSNGVGTVNGGATVTWSANEGSRTVDVDAEWVGPDHTIDVSASRSIRLLDPSDGLSGGLVIDGSRTWTVDGSSTWEQTIDSVEMRPIDPAPQAGSYTLVNPAGRQLSLDFERVDANTIRVTAEARRVRTWLVTAAGISDE